MKYDNQSFSPSSSHPYRSTEYTPPCGVLCYLVSVLFRMKLTFLSINSVPQSKHLFAQSTSAACRQGLDHPNPAYTTSYSILLPSYMDRSPMRTQTYHNTLRAWLSAHTKALPQLLAAAMLHIHSNHSADFHKNTNTFHLLSCSCNSFTTQEGNQIPVLAGFFQRYW